MIKWTGKNTQMNCAWKVDANTLEELYNELVKRDIIREEDYNPIHKFLIERAGMDYREVVEQIEILEEEQFHDLGKAEEYFFEKNCISRLMTDQEYYQLIKSENGNAYYQDFEDENGNEIEFDEEGYISTAKKIKSLSYIYGKEYVQVGKVSYFGEIWDGEGDGNELLESGSIFIGDVCCEFTVVERNEDILKTIVSINDL